MKRLLLGLLGLYRWLVSPVLHALAPGGCKFHPSCSQYATEAVEIHGAWRGGWMALRRLLRCHPFSRGGFDPVALPPAHPTASSIELPTGISATSAGTLSRHDPLP